ncbi:MAG TPA: hypothetical protein VFN24_01670, partial [Microbacterium sp.]|nr:hypothetical protein [Microbacterium sp.]
DDVMRDAGGRRQPAHLDVHTAPEHPTPDMLAHYRESQPRVSWHFRRSERDRRRRVSGAAAAADQPTQSTVAEWKREQRRRRLAAAKVQARRELEFDDYPDDIHIDPRERVRPS